MSRVAHNTSQDHVDMATDITSSVVIRRLYLRLYSHVAFASRSTFNIVSVVIKMLGRIVLDPFH